MVNLIQKMKEIERLVCENCEQLEIDDRIEEGFYEDYLLVEGASDGEIEAFEDTFNMKLPEDMKDLYRYKNGSAELPVLFPNDKYDRDFSYSLLSLEDIAEHKEYFQNKNLLITEFYSYNDDDDTKKLLMQMEDPRVKPYLWNKKWMPFAEADGDVFLMMDFDPNDDGTYGQIICYIHDPDEIAFTAKTITEILNDTVLNVACNKE